MTKVDQTRRLLMLLGGLVLAALIVVAARWPKTQDGIVLGAAFPLSGSYAQYGVVPRNAIELAVARRLASGFPHRVRVHYEDTQLRPALALSAVRKLIDIHHVPVIFGPAGSNESEVAGPFAQLRSVVMISPSSTAAALSRVGPYFFRTIPSDTYEGTFMARFVYRRGARRVGVFAVNDTGTKSLADAFRGEFLRLGGAVTGYVLGPKDTNDLRTQITSLRASSPEAVFVMGYGNEIGVFLAQAQELGFRVPFYSAHPAEAPEVRTIAASGAEGLIFSSATNPSTSGPARDFRDAYRRRYGEVPGEFGAEAYDAAMLVLDAIAAVGTTPERIRDHLHGVRGYEGASGTITFLPTGDVEKPIRAMTIRAGTVVPLDG